MTKNKSTLVKESVIRRWGKLANMPSLTENWLDTISEEDAEEEMEMDMGAEAADDAAEAGMDAEEAGAPAAEEEAAVERIVSAVVDAISSETGVDIEVGADGEMADDAAEMEMGADDAEGDADDPAMRDSDPAMRDKAPYNKKDLDESEDTDEEETTTEAKAKDEDEDAEEVSEDLNLEVVDDEALTEAVLKRVVERLLKRQ